MSNQPAHPSPPPIPNSPPSGGVRRHHTISASSRTARAGARIAESEESQQTWKDDEVVDPDWVGGVGAVGEKSAGLHRQSSLPTRYNRAFQRAGQAARQPGTLTPRTMNSLSAITAEHGHEGEEEEWEKEIQVWGNEDEDGQSAQEHNLAHQLLDSQSQGSSHSPISPQFAQIPSPPPASANVRRHQSLTYGAAGGPRRVATGLKRSGTLQAQIERPGADHSPSPPSNEEDLVEEQPPTEEDYYIHEQQAQLQNQYNASAVGRSSPWRSQTNDWRGNLGNNAGMQGGNGSSAIDDVQRALSALDVSGNNQSHLMQGAGYQAQVPAALGGAAQTSGAPRFNQYQQQQQQQQQSQPQQYQQQQGAGMRRGDNGNGNSINSRSGKLQLVTDFDGKSSGPVSAGATVPPIGHGVPLQQQPVHVQQRGGVQRDERTFPVSASSAPSWDQKDRVLSTRTSNPNLYTAGYGNNNMGLPPNPPLPAQYLNQQGGQAPRLGVMTTLGQGGQIQGQGQTQGAAAGAAGGQQGSGFIGSPIDIPTLIATKGYNPVEFDIRPAFARYFVIKSYTEDDVHKSLKYEIWSSTDPGNKRLDKAFKETAGRGPIYLFFSVNASGHFCGMAEMLTPVDHTRSSTVWASDKWKGVFKVRWIFVRDIPNANLRHIRLNNTQERKPVTNSRDTQELLPDAGQEMLRIFFSHPARTSLLQDFAFYELQSMQRVQQQGPSSPTQGPATAQQPQQQVAAQGQQQHPFAMANPASMAYPSGAHLAMPPMGAPMMQMQMNSQYTHPHTIQSVMRNPSPIPVTQAGYMGMGGGF
ncbi:YTH-domain-containing protein [Rickenella mellea]|uniref:YTH-domain-containing protein n=1 Tax=Rickenella mellea TaxID=50990 RepID=A0A4Y7QB98_9AGAM|nr:YTH-domain-containing protein [Rickenella mellea]